MRSRNFTSICSRWPGCGFSYRCQRLRVRSMLLIGRQPVHPVPDQDAMHRRHGQRTADESVSGSRRSCPGRSGSVCRRYRILLTTSARRGRAATDAACSAGPPGPPRRGRHTAASTGRRPAAKSRNAGTSAPRCATGVPNSFILINEGIAIDEACEIKPTWNAAVCKGDIGRMNIGGGGGGRGFGGGRGAGGAAAGPGAAPGRAGAAGPRDSAVLAALHAARLLAATLGCAGPGGAPLAVLQAVLRGVVAHLGRSRCAGAAGGAAQPPARSQPQWQGVHRNLGHNVPAVPRSR